MHDLVNPSRRHTYVVSEPVLGQAKRLEEVMKQDFPRVNRIKLASGHHAPH
jgi:hypothetical protein